ncbi:MAG: hypothetical protein KTR25_01570 [Myxococcales bacterium]|nr:hypothetical protein [Myxococcales bacterium]
MGGLAGYFAPNSLDISVGSRLLGRMLDTLNERCPQSHRGAVSGDTLGLGMRGPKTIPKGPYRNGNANLVWAVDGRIRLRSGATNRPLSEEIEQLYNRWGEGLFRFIDGPFLLALWDAHTHQLLLGRDAFGQRPLCYSWVDYGRMLLFASEAKALLASGKVEPCFDGRGVMDVFSVGHPVSPGTLFVGIEQLPSGTWLRVDRSGKVVQGQWYSAPYRTRGQKQHVTQLPAGDEGLDQAQAGHIRGRLRDVLGPVPAQSALWVREEPGSVLLAGLIAEANTQLTLFQGGFDGSRSGSHHFQWAERIAEILDVAHVGVSLQRLEASDYLQVVRALEVPALGSSPFCEAQIYRAAVADGRRGVFSSVGVDSVLGGKNSYYANRGWWERMWMTTRLRRFPGLPRALRNSWRMASHYGRRWGAIPSQLESWVVTAFVADSLVHRRHRLPSGPSRWPQVIEGAPLFLSKRQYRALRVHQKTALESELWRNDRLAAHSGLETYLPYVDQRMVMCSSKLNPSDLSRGGGMHAVRYALLDDLRSFRRMREKNLRYRNPIWPFGPGMSSWVRDTLTKDKLDALGIFAAEEVHRMLSRLSEPGLDQVSLVEAMVLNGVLGLQLLADSFGVTNIRWPDR